MRAVMLALALILTIPSLATAVDCGQRPPDFSLSSSGEEKVRLSNFNGKVVYLDFWASWCPPCKASLPWMNELKKKYGEDGFEVIAINVDSDREDAEALLRQLQPDFKVAYDPKGETPGLFKLSTMPSSFLIDKKGNVVSVHKGFRESQKNAIEKEIETLLAQ